MSLGWKSFHLLFLQWQTQNWTRFWFFVSHSGLVAESGFALAELCSENISLSQSTFKLIGVVIQAKHHPCIHISENPTLGTYRP